MRGIILSTLLAITLAACTPTATSVPEVQRTSAGEAIDIASAGAQLSLLRAQNGIVRPLGYSPALQAAAESHAQYMNRTGNFSHRGAGGSRLQNRLRQAGYQFCRASENIAAGQTNLGRVLNDWMASRGHRANILDARVTQYGLARSGAYWVVVFGRPAPC